jgi:hypothetical protein
MVIAAIGHEGAPVSKGALWVLIGLIAALITIEVLLWMLLR